MNIKKIALLLISFFILNFIWETSQAFLYAPHYVGIAGLITVHLRASLGDMLMIFVILFLDIIIFSRIFENKMSPWRFLAMIIAGFALAVAVEKYALSVGRWAYDPRMPMIPGLNVGLIPALQMMLIPSGVIMIFEGLKNKHPFLS